MTLSDQITIREECSCWATFEIIGPAHSYTFLQEQVEKWRTDHRHSPEGLPVIVIESDRAEHLEADAPKEDEGGS